MKKFLAGDVGGTKTRLGWFVAEDGVRAVDVEVFESGAFQGVGDIIEAFLARHPGRAEAAAFGIAGPVMDGRATLPNLSWTVDAVALKRRLDVDKLCLINDLEANAHGIATLEPDQFLVLQDRERRKGNAALIAAGTGLGECILVLDGTAHRPIPTEGGHCDFAPRNEWEMDFLRFLSTRYPEHVSYERVLSGSGIVALFDFIVSRGGKPSLETERARRSSSDAAPILSAAGLDASCPVCVEVLDRFLEIYGAEAGNLALKGLALHGLYIGGGIAPKLRDRLREGAFMRGFRAKGRFRSLMEEIRVEVILNEGTALLGAARYAMMCAGRDPVALRG